MAANNLRIIYQNFLDPEVTGGTVPVITGLNTATGFSTSNMRGHSYKGFGWRSQTNTVSPVVVNLILNLQTQRIANTLVLAYSNLGYNSTVSIYGSNSAPSLAGTVDAPSITSPGTLIVTSTGNQLTPYLVNNRNYWDTEPASINAPRLGYARLYFSNTTAYQYYSLVITNPDPIPAHYIEIGKIVLGNYWSPKYNTSYGLGQGLIDMSSNVRTEDGGLVTLPGNTYNTLSFDLKYMDPSDRNVFNKLIRYSTSRKPIWISLFPDNTADYLKEQQYQIYGKLKSIPGLEHPMFDIYSSQIEIEEI
jgi:hypothetical protein